jgi:tRNA G37 N-methylase Trm5
MLVNSARGEVPLKIGTAEVVLCAEMQRMAMFSDRLGNTGLKTIFQRLSESDVSALYSFIDCFTIDGDVAKLKAEIKTFEDLAKIQEAALKVLEIFTEKPSSKKE